MSHEERLQKMLESYIALLARCDQVQAELDSCRELANEVHKQRLEWFDVRDRQVTEQRERLRNAIAVMREAQSG